MEAGDRQRFAAPLELVRSLTGNRAIVRLILGYGLFTVCEYSVWLAILVYAYAHGGTTAAGLVAVGQLVPAALVAPVMAVRSDNGSPVSMLLVGYACQVGGLGVAAIVIDTSGPSAAVYAGAVLAASALTAVRPAQAVVLPGLARSANELTAANVALGWIEAVGIAISGVWVAALLSAGVGQVLAAGVILVGAAGWLVAELPVQRGLVATEDVEASLRAEILDGFAAVRDTAGARAVVALLFTQDIVLGALDILFVVIAFALLHRAAPWVGYLNTAFGVGSLLAGGVTLLLIGRRLPAPIVATAVALGGALALVPALPEVGVTVALLAVVGGSRAVFDVASRTLLQRTVPTDVLGRVFGLVEGLTMAGLAIGSILVPLLDIGGPTVALVGVGLLLPVVAIGASRQLRRLDRDSRIPVVEIALLRTVDIFALLPGPEIESLARSLRLMTLAPNDALIVEGDYGDAYYVIADGQLSVSQRGSALGVVGRGEGVGEIALIRDVPRTATVRALTACQIYALPREAFLVATTRHLPTMQLAGERVAQRLQPGGSAPVTAD
jgi:hypothetical protein